jgi:hypothetical protein
MPAVRGIAIVLVQLAEAVRELKTVLPEYCEQVQALLGQLFAFVMLVWSIPPLRPQ